MTRTATPTRWSTETATRMNVNADKPVIITPCDHGGWMITYGDDLILAKDGCWVDGSSVDLSTEVGEAEITWHGQDTATAAILATI